LPDRHPFWEPKSIVRQLLVIIGKPIAINLQALYDPRGDRNRPGLVMQLNYI
jgi:hypothetical protein